jgi:pimeloyl-ACP methyl ester carboxylesterase
MDATPSIPQNATRVLHRWLDLEGMKIFYREAGEEAAPVLLLPHGYPCSSYEFRDLMPAMADRWRLLAPDFPGCGHSDTPEGFAHDFDGYAEFLARFAERLRIKQFAIYLHDFGSQIGLRLAIRHPDRIAAVIIQNGDIYEDVLGPKYDGLKEYWDHPTSEARAKIGEAVNEEGFREEFLNDVAPDVAQRISPDLWKLHAALTDERRRQIIIGIIAGLRENRDWFPRYQSYLRERQPPALILWGPRDGYMPEKSGRAFLRDLPNAEFHLFETGGHWLLETHLDEVVPIMRDFLGRVLPARPAAG